MSRPPAIWKRPAYLPPDVSLGDTAVIDVMMRYVTRRHLVIQAGAHVGLWPAVLSQHFRNVVSFEPDPRLAAVAREAADYANVSVHTMALTDSSKELALMMPSGEKMARYSGSATVGPEGEPVQGVAIDDYEWWGVGAIVLDIEGHELPALKGAVRTIEKWKPVIVVEENAKSLRHRAPGEMERFLHEFSYKLLASYKSDLIFGAP